MNKFLNIVYMSVFAFSLIACQHDAPKEMKMFTDKIQKLISARNEDYEEEALGELLVTAKQTGISYGYRVFDLTTNQRVNPDQINNVLKDKLQVTIFVGEKPPYEEFIWQPKYNGHITRLIMP